MPKIWLPDIQKCLGGMFRKYSAPSHEQQMSVFRSRQNQILNKSVLQQLFGQRPLTAKVACSGQQLAVGEQINAEHTKAVLRASTYKYRRLSTVLTRDQCAP
jgi:hypothetical protein